MTRKQHLGLSDSRIRKLLLFSVRSTATLKLFYLSSILPLVIKAINLLNSICKEFYLPRELRKEDHSRLVISIPREGKMSVS